jgi:hypothetical protein
MKISDHDKIYKIKKTPIGSQLNDIKISDHDKIYKIKKTPIGSQLNDIKISDHDKIYKIKKTPIGSQLNDIKISDNFDGVDLSKTMKLSLIDIHDKFQGLNLSWIDIHDKFQGLNLSWILICYSSNLMKRIFKTEWLILERGIEPEWLKEYYEKIGFIDINYERYMYARIDTILGNIRCNKVFQLFEI